MNKIRIIALFGKSGAGKDFIQKKLEEKLQKQVRGTEKKTKKKLQNIKENTIKKTKKKLKNIKENITKKTKKKLKNVTEITAKKTKKTKKSFKINIIINAIWIVLIVFMMIALCRKTNNEKVVFKIERYT